jgi:hypothetical protein
VTSIKRRIALVKMRLTGHATYKVSGGRAEMWRNEVGLHAQLSEDDDTLPSLNGL